MKRALTMKRTLMVVISLILVILVSNTVFAQSQYQVQKDTVKLKGFFASASFSSVADSKSCVVGWTDLAVADEMIKSAPGKPAEYQNGWISIVQYDRCRGELLRAAFGGFVE